VQVVVCLLHRVFKLTVNVGRSDTLYMAHRNSLAWQFVSVSCLAGVSVNTTNQVPKIAVKKNDFPNPHRAI